MKEKSYDIIIFSLGAVIIGMLISAVFLSFNGVNSLVVIKEAINTIAMDKYLIGEILVKATPYIFTSLAFAFTYKANLFNIGAQGQFYAGAVVAVSISLMLGNRGLPWFVIIPVVAVFSFFAGGIVGALIGFAKSKFGANEFLVSMMSTYVISSFVDYLLRTFLREAKGEYLQTDAIARNAYLPKIIDGTRVHLGFIIAILAAIGIWILLQKTSLGFRIRAVGRNPRASEVSGINTRGIYIIAFMISGGLAGLAGLTEINGVQHMLLQNFNSNLGSSGIGIAILANGNPIGIIFASILFGGISVIGTVMGKMNLNIPSSITDLMQGLVMLCVIVSYFVRRKVEKNRDKKTRLKAGVKND